MRNTAHHRVLNPPLEHAKKRQEKFCKPALAGVVGRQLSFAPISHHVCELQNAQGQVLIVQRVLYIMNNLTFRLCIGCRCRNFPKNAYLAHYTYSLQRT